MKKVTFLVFFCIPILLSSCFDLFNPSYWKGDGFAVGTDPGDPSALQLTNSENSILLSSVIKIGDNDKFIIVETAFKDKSYFWIIEKEKNLSHKVDLEGPFSFKEFNERKLELGISKLEFERVFKRKNE